MFPFPAGIPECIIPPFVVIGEPASTPHRRESSRRSLLARPPDDAAHVELCKSNSATRMTTPTEDNPLPIADWCIQRSTINVAKLFQVAACTGADAMDRL